MAAVLVITRDKIQIDKISVGTSRFVIGRSKSCDLPLNDAIMSRQHCTITESGGAYTIEDNGSRNGTDVNGTQISGPTPLTDGDKITLGPFELTFYASGGEEIAAAQDDFEADAATRFAGAEDIQKVRKKAEDVEAVSASATVRIEVTSGPLKGTTYKGWHGDLVIGRGSESDVILPDDAVSTRHARIFKDANGRFAVEDFGSSNGTYVNNVRIREREMLTNGAKVRIGTTVMEYHEVDPVKQKAAKRRIAIVALAVALVLVLLKVLTPEDRTEEYLARGREFLLNGDYTNAIAAFELVLNESDDHPEALEGISIVNSEMQAQELLGRAKEVAMNEEYGQAEDICHSVLRLHPDNEEAQEMLAVLERVKDSKIAADAKNWVDAIRLIQQALETYPDSDVLRTGLDRAKGELRAETSLRDAAALQESKEYAKAGDVLRTIGERSAYYKEAREQLALLDKLAEAQNAYLSAVDAYRQGDEETALQRIRAGLDTAPQYEDLRKLRDDIQLLAPLKAKLKAGEELLASTDVAALRELIVSCDAMANLRIESDDITQVRADAAAFGDKVRSRLSEIAEEAFRAGHKAMARGDEREALQQFNIASQAEPGNAEAVAMAEELREKLLPLIKERFQQAMVHEELQQIELAIAAYEEVLEIAIPGDSYYDRAQTRLKRLK